ncbi:CYTH domain-containing protein [Anoxybacillus ayderensis]|uniref:CYTH domain-containing protein n=1 Tax=Anoxybacillus ayderensis TaxID=265546 RepID=UPI002E1F1606|nr:CYTH domain-containing protein [Anoxybacillus ayderensis]
MRHELEIEFKNMLTAEEFARLTTAFAVRDDEWSVQQNYYFDTPDFQLKRQKSALRIRMKNDTYTLTLKQPYEDGLLETHERLTKQTANALISGTQRLGGEMANTLQLLHIDPTAVVCFGALTTRRVERPYKNGTLVFDFSEYMNVSDYEVEYEATDRTEGEKTFTELLQSFHIPKRKTKNKIERFYEAKYETERSS